MSFLENKIPPPILMTMTGLVMYMSSLYTEPLLLSPYEQGLAILILLIFSGLFGFNAIKLFRKAQTTINPVQIENATNLVTDGIYQRSRNPMYVSMTLILCAWSILLASPYQLLGPIFFVAYINRFQIIPEERVMAEKFGADYEDYKSQVRRWL